MPTETWDTETAFDAGTFDDTYTPAGRVELVDTVTFDFKITTECDITYSWYIEDADTGTTLASGSGSIADTTVTDTVTIDVTRHPNLTGHIEWSGTCFDAEKTDPCYLDGPESGYFVDASAGDDVDSNSDTTTKDFSSLGTRASSGTWTSETRTTDLEVEWQTLEVSATVPTDTSLDLTVADEEGNSVTVSVPDGTSTHDLEAGLTWSDAMHVSASLSTSVDDTPELQTVTVHRSDPITAPTNGAVPGHPADGLGLVWDPPSDTYQSVDQYTIYRDTASGSASTGDYSKVTTVSGGTTTYTDTGLADGERYYYRLTATVVVDDGDGTTTTVRTEISTEFAGTVNLPAPEGLTVTGIRDTELDLSWTNNHDNGSVTIQTRPTGTATWDDQATGLALTTESATIDGLRNGEKYDIRVLAVTSHASTADLSVNPGETVTVAAGATLDTITGTYSVGGTVDNEGTITCQPD